MPWEDPAENNSTFNDGAHSVQGSYNDGVFGNLRQQSAPEVTSLDIFTNIMSFKVSTLLCIFPV